MKAKSLLMFAGGMLALGWCGTAYASAVDGSVTLKNLTVSTTGTAEVHFHATNPTSTSADAFAGLYDSTDSIYQLVADGGVVSASPALGTTSTSVAGTLGSATASDTPAGLSVSVHTPDPVFSQQFAYASTSAMADLWKNFTITGVGTVRFTADYTADLADAFGNPLSNKGLQDTGIAWAGLSLYKVDGNSNVVYPLIKYSDQGIQISEWQSDHKDSSTTGKLSVAITLRQATSQVYALNAYTGAEVNDPHATPEPATMLLLGSGVAGLVGIRRKKA